MMEKDFKKLAVSAALGLDPAKVSSVDVDISYDSCGCWEPCGCSDRVEIFAGLSDGSSVRETKAIDDMGEVLARVFEAGMKAGS